MTFLRLLKRLLRPEPPSAAAAKNRLQLVLARERSDLTAVDLGEMKKDLVEVISRYFEIDEESLSIEILDKEGQRALSVSTALETPAVPRAT
jgi:cell division topological specificity factor